MRVLMPLPSTDFDPTEAAVPWRELTDAGAELTFATPDGEPGEADDRLLSGRGFGPWRPLLRSGARARKLYGEMEQAPAFRDPLAYDEIDVDDFDAMVLPGGHAPGMTSYLESEELQRRVGAFAASERPIAAICHGVVLLSRAEDPETGSSVLRGHRVTALTRTMELSAWALTGLWLGDYYRTYPTTVEEEVRESVGPEGTFETGPLAILPDGPDRLDRGFTIRDGTFLTARWPGDAHRFAADAIELFGEA